MEYLERVRRCELDLVLPLLPIGARVLEIGAGAGWQASVLAEKGFTVDAVDTEGSLYEQERIWPVTIYDGHVLPFAGESFDVVYSSSVLEHIPHVEEFQHEIQRVLKADGMAIHILPSASWRFWTSVAYYVHFLRELKNTSASLRAKFYRFRTNRWAPRHGEFGDSFTEIYTFSRRAWLKVFRAVGWTVVKTYTNRLFYTGYDTFNYSLPLRVRHLMSYALGSACNIICLRKPTGAATGTNPERKWSR
jgi:ubiquinone/menaquinone biosynthesis C-methylase UbiE